MAAVLILLLAGYFSENVLFYQLAIPVLVLDMIAPGVFARPAVLWFGLAHLLGSFTSRVILSLIFFLLVVPVGVCRRIMGKDSLKLKQFKQGRGSVMDVRDHRFTAADLSNPF